MKYKTIVFSNMQEQVIALYFCEAYLNDDCLRRLYSHLNSIMLRVKMISWDVSNDLHKPLVYVTLLILYY